MRKHTTKTIPQYGVKYRPLTIGDLDVDSCIVEGAENLYSHQKDYVHIMALLDTMNYDSVGLQITCPECKELVKFPLYRNAIMVDEFGESVFGNEIKLSVHPRKTGKEDMIELIDFVVIDGEQIPWEDCKEAEKEAVLDSIDYSVFKSINSALDAPAVIANIPVRCSCGCEKIISLRGLQAFLKVI